MKRTVKLFGFIVIAAVIGFSFVSCNVEPETDELDGTTWKGSDNSGYGYEHILTFKIKGLTHEFEWNAYGKGKYEIGNDDVVLAYNGGGMSYGKISGEFRDTLTFTATTGDAVWTFTKQ